MKGSNHCSHWPQLCTARSSGGFCQMWKTFSWLKHVLSINAQYKCWKRSISSEEKDLKPVKWQHGLTGLIFKATVRTPVAFGLSVGSKVIFEFVSTWMILVDCLYQAEQTKLREVLGSKKNLFSHSKPCNLSRKHFLPQQWLFSLNISRCLTFIFIQVAAAELWFTNQLFFWTDSLKKKS